VVPGLFLVHLFSFNCFFLSPTATVVVAFATIEHLPTLQWAVILSRSYDWKRAAVRFSCLSTTVPRPLSLARLAQFSDLTLFLARIDTPPLKLPTVTMTRTDAIVRTGLYRDRRHQRLVSGSIPGGSTVDDLPSSISPLVSLVSSLRCRMLTTFVPNLGLVDT